MMDSSKGLGDSFELVFSYPSLLVPVFLEQFFVLSIFLTSLLPLFAVAGRSFLSNWSIFFSSFRDFSLFFSFIFIIDLFLALLAVSFCRSLFLSMAGELWSKGSCSLSDPVSKGLRFLEPLFFANLFSFALSGAFLAGSAFFFFSALNSVFPFSSLFLFLGVFCFLCFSSAFFSFFWREPAILVHGSWQPALRASFSLFRREGAQTIRLWFLFFALSALAGLASSGPSFSFIGAFLGFVVSAYTRLARVFVFLDQK